MPYKILQIAVVALTIFGSTELQADLNPKLPAYPGSIPASMIANMLTNDVPLDAEIYMSSDDIQSILEYYREFLSRHDIEIVEHMFNSQSGYIGFHNSQLNKMQLVTLFTVPPKMTMFIISSMDPRSLISNQVQIPKDLPSVPGAVDIVTTESNESNSSGRTISYFLPSKSIVETKKQLHQSARELGWSDASLPEHSNNFLVLKRKRAQCIINLLPRSDATIGKEGTAVIMSIVESSPSSTR
jgi:hypothetical protein